MLSQRVNKCNMKLAEKYPILASSVDPKNVSLMIKGVSSLVASIAVISGVEIDQTSVEGALVSIWAGVSGAVALIGLLRKFVN